MRYYTSVNRYLQQRFGCKVYKVALSGGFTCPNRDGTLDSRGCIFCSRGGSGDFAGDPAQSITGQLCRGKAALAGKIKNGKYIAYFQSYTGTYAPVERLRALYTEALADPQVVALSVATRPDCLPPQVLDLLAELNRQKPVFVELGLQTIHRNSAAYIRRGYPLLVFDQAMANLTAIGVNKVVHIILGLPGESRDQMAESVRYAVDHGADGLKLQLLTAGAKGSGHSPAHRRRSQTRPDRTPVVGRQKGGAKRHPCPLCALSFAGRNIVYYHTRFRR